MKHHQCHPFEEVRKSFSTTRLRCRIGPYDYAPSPGAMTRAIDKRQIPFCAPGSRNDIAVKDVAQGIVNAIRQGKIGEACIMGHQDLTYREMFNLVASTLGVKAAGMVVPRPVLILSGLIIHLSNIYGIGHFICKESYCTQNRPYFVGNLIARCTIHPHHDRFRTT